MSTVTVLAAIDESPTALPVLATARHVATLIGGAVRAVHVREDDEALPVRAAAEAGVELHVLAGPPERTLREQAGAADVRAVVLGTRRQPDGGQPIGHLARELMTSLAKPVVLVPPDARETSRIDRVLVPLDGAPASARALAETIALARGADASIVVLHVHDAPRLPMFSDQPAYEAGAFLDEFASRNIAQPGADVRVQSRVGQPHEHVVDVARTEDVDLIALGWSQHLDPGRARVVRETLTRSPVPTLLVPVGPAAA